MAFHDDAIFHYQLISVWKEMADGRLELAFSGGPSALNDCGKSL
jgi:hypothetical protein